MYPIAAIPDHSLGSEADIALPRLIVRAAERADNCGGKVPLSVAPWTGLQPKEPQYEISLHHTPCVSHACRNARNAMTSQQLDLIAYIA